MGHIEDSLSIAAARVGVSLGVCCDTYPSPTETGAASRILELLSFVPEASTLQVQSSTMPIPYLTKLPELSRVIGDSRGHRTFAAMTDVRLDELERLKSVGAVSLHHDEFGAL